MQKKKSVENYKEVLSLRQGEERSAKGDWIRLIVVNMYGEAEEFKGDWRSEHEWWENRVAIYQK